jgi:hypothetical protein
VEKLFSCNREILPIVKLTLILKECFFVDDKV